MPIPNRYYESVRGWSPSVLQNIAASNRFFPVTEKVRQVDWHGGFTAGGRPRPLHGPDLSRSTTGTRRPSSPSRPGTWSPRSRSTRTGRDFHSHNAWNLLASDDEWTSPILAEVGPDGHVWVIDWYNYIVQHNPTPEGFKTGKGARLRDPAARQDARADLPDRREGRQAERAAEAVEGRPEGARRRAQERQHVLAAARPAAARRAGRQVRRARPRRPDRRAGRLDRPERRGCPCDLGAARAGRAADGRSGPAATTWSPPS